MKVAHAAPPGNSVPRRPCQGKCCGAIKPAWSVEGERLASPGAAVCRVAGEVDVRPLPHLAGHLLAQLAAIAIAGREMNAAVDARPAGRLGSRRQRIPVQAHVLCRAGFDLEAVGTYRCFEAEGIAV